MVFEEIYKKWRQTIYGIKRQMKAFSSQEMITIIEVRKERAPRRDPLPGAANRLP